MYGNQGIIIFSGFNERAVISFCRIAEKYNLSYYIIAKSNNDQIFFSKYRSRVTSTRKSVELVEQDVFASLNEVKRKSSKERYYIVPTSEALNRFLLSKRNKLSINNYFIPLVDEKLYCKISDKYSFGEACLKYGINIPNEIKINNIKTFPVVVKPKTYCSSKGNILTPQILYSKSQHDEFLTNYEEEDFYCQEYIGGKSFYLLYYFGKNGSFCSFSQENLVQQACGKSILLARPATIHKDGISNKFVSLFQHSDFFGLVMVEVKYFNGMYWMIEANPRMWGPSQLYIDCNIEILEKFLIDLGFDIDITEEDKQVKTNSIYFWFGGLLESMKFYGSIQYHEFTQNDFINIFNLAYKSDVYMRYDTKDIYFQKYSPEGEIYGT